MGVGGLATAGVAVCAVVAGVALLIAQRDNGIPAPPAALRPTLPQVAHYVENRWSGPEGRMFCGVRYLGNSRLGDRFSLYVWEGGQQYRVADGRLVRGTGWSSPAVVTVAGAPGMYRILDEQEPLDYHERLWSPMFPCSRVRSANRSLEGATHIGR